MTVIADDITRILARFATEVRSEAIPARVRHEARRALVNGLGAALGAAGRPEVSIPVAVLGAQGAGGIFSVIGRRERLAMLDAAFVNGIAINALDFDDTHLPTVIHPTAPIAPPLIALAERGGITGRALVDAFALGIEVACRLGNAVSPGHYARGFHITATCGIFGAAAAAGRLIGLDAERMIGAFASAGGQASGLVENLPTQAKSTSVGGAARGGLLSALLAERDWSGAPQSIEGRFGFARVLADQFDPSAITGGLGEQWEVLKNDYKPYPCGVVLNPVLDACLALAASDAIDPIRIAGVTVYGHKLLGIRADRGVVSDGQLTRLSIHHCAAIAFVHRRAGVDEFTEACARENAVQALAAKVRYQEDPACPVESARVVVRLADGAEHVHRVAHARGSATRPLTDADLEAKARMLAAYGAPGCNIDRLIETVWTLDELPDARVLAECARLG
ncbi:MAG: MmgE/PrpD family protein [Burkholderiales bacterium]